MNKSDVKILVIDDNVRDTYPLIVELKMSYAEVLVFNKSQEGMEYVQKHLKEKMIVILDIRFASDKELNGHQVLEKIREKTELVPVILWSAINEEESEFSDFINNHAFAFVKQTSDYGDLIEKVKEAEEALNMSIPSLIEEWINKHSERIQQRPYLTTKGGKTYSLKEVAKEIREQTAFGKRMHKNILKLAIDLLARQQEETDD